MLSLRFQIQAQIEMAGKKTTYLLSPFLCSGHLSTVKKFVGVKLKALEADDPTKKLTLLQVSTL